MSFRSFKVVLAACAISVFGLASCYQSKQAIVTRDVSSKVPGLDGEVQTGKTFVSRFRYDASRRDYGWVTVKQGRIAKAGRFRAFPIDRDLWLFQFREKGSRPIHMLVFYRFDRGRRRLQVMLPGRTFEELRRFAERFGVAMDDDRRLTGSVGNIRRFLKAHRSIPFSEAKH